MAKIFLVMAKGKMTDEKLKEKMEKHKAPKNCDIPVPRVNNEIWSVMENIGGWLQLTSQSLKICLAVVSKMPAPKLTPLPNSEQTLRSQLKE